MEWIVFIVIELVGLIPLVFYLFLLHSENDPSSNLLLHRMKRHAIASCICVALCIPLYLFLPLKKLNIVLLSVLLQIVTLFFFKKGKL